MKFVGPLTSGIAGCHCIFFFLIVTFLLPSRAFISFLDAFPHLYERVCLLVGRSHTDQKGKKCDLSVDVLTEKQTAVTPHNTGRQGTNKFHLLLADFRYCQYRKLKEMTWWNQGLAFVIGGFPLLLGPVSRGLTVFVICLCLLSLMSNTDLHPHESLPSRGRNELHAAGNEWLSFLLAVVVITWIELVKMSR